MDSGRITKELFQHWNQRKVVQKTLWKLFRNSDNEIYLDIDS